MNRTIVVVLAFAVLCSGAVATTAAFTDGDEVVDGSEVYLTAADTENGDKYVQIDQSGEISLRFDTLPPGSQTRVDDLFLVSFAGYDDSHDATTIRLDSTDDRVAVERMDTGESFGSGTVELEPGESVLFGAVISTSGQDFSSTIEVEVDVPDTDDGSGGGGGAGGGGGGAGGTGGDDSDDQVGDDDTDTPEETTEDGDEAGGVSDDGNGAAVDDDSTDPSVDSDSDADPGIGLIELAGFGNPLSLIAVAVLAALLSLSYAYRLQLIAGSLESNTGGSK